MFLFCIIYIHIAILYTYISYIHICSECIIHAQFLGAYLSPQSIICRHAPNSLDTQVWWTMDNWEVKKPQAMTISITILNKIQDESLKSQKHDMIQHDYHAWLIYIYSLKMKYIAAENRPAMFLSTSYLVAGFDNSTRHCGSCRNSPRKLWVTREERTFDVSCRSNQADREFWFSRWWFRIPAFNHRLDV